MQENQAWDALDQPDDKPKPTETIYAYKLSKQLGHCHINLGNGKGGFYPVVEYTFVPEQPSQDVMRDPDRWKRWCEHQLPT